jgi:hypothetical protein
MPESFASLCDAGDLITSARAQAAEMLALVCARAPATEVALAATVLRDTLAELDRLHLDSRAVAVIWDEARADGVNAGIAIGRAALLAEQAAAAEACPPPVRLRVVRTRTHPGTGPHPVTRGA